MTPETDVQQLNFDGTPFYPEPETLIAPEKQSLIQRIGNTALHTASLAQEKIANTVGYLKQEGGKIVARTALAGLAIAGNAGLMNLESGSAEAAATHIESGGPSSKPGASLSFGWNVYVNFNRAATKQMENYQVLEGGGFAGAAFACRFAPLVVKDICEGTYIAEGIDLEWALQQAERKNECVQLKIPYTTYEAIANPAVRALMIEKRVVPVPNWGWEPCKS